MIPRVLGSGPGFAALIDYLIDEGRELLAYANESILSFASAGVEMEAVAGLNPRLRAEPERAMLHYTLAWDPSERPDVDEMLSVSLRSLAALGFGEVAKVVDNRDGQDAASWKLLTDHQVVIVLHNDSASGHYHAHIVANRQPMHGRKLLNIHRPYRKLDAFAREMEVRYGRTQAPGIHSARVDGDRIILERIDQGANPKRLVSPSARDGELQSGLPSFGRWIEGRCGSDLRAVLDDQDAEAADLFAALAPWRATIVPYKSGFVIADRSDIRKRVAASAIDSRLGAEAISGRFGHIVEPMLLPEALTHYAADVRRFAPDSIRDSYERKRRTWRESSAGVRHAKALDELGRRTKSERARLRRELDSARRSAQAGADPAVALDLAELIYSMRRAELEAEIRDERRRVQREADLAGRPAASFFKEQSRESRSAGDDRRVLSGGGGGGSGARLSGLPRQVDGLDLRPGARGADYWRGRLRVLSIGVDEIQVLTNDERDLAAGVAVARTVFSEPIFARGSPAFLASARTLGVAPRRAVTPTQG